MNKKLVGSICVLVAVAAAGTAWWRGRAAAPAPQAAAPGARPGGGGPQSVNTAAVQRRDVPVTVDAAGTVVSLNTVDVRPQVSSTIRTVAIREGQFVRKGDLLFTFDDRADRANLDRARAQLLRDRATLADLERQWKRAQELRAQNFIAQSAADTVQAQLEAQQAAVRADDAAVQAAEVSLSFATLRSPLTGRAGAINVYPGSLVQPASATPLVTISQIDPIGVSFTVPEAQLAALLQPAAGSGGGGRPVASGGKPAAADKPGAAPALPSVPVSVRLPTPERGRNAPPAEALQGKLSFIDNAVDTTTGTIRLKGSIANPKQQLWPGQYVNVRITLRTIKDALVVPQAAIVQRGPERSVYVVQPDQTAQLVPVQPRYPFGEFVVVEGLAEGDRVVVEGKQNLRPGAAVREAPAKPGAAASGAAPDRAPGGASSTASGAAR